MEFYWIMNQLKAIRRIQGWQRVVGELLMEKTFQAVNFDSIHILPEVIISDSCIARFERYISFEMGKNLQNPAVRWEPGVPHKLATLSSFI
ncbi:hypothetical protein SADUNF_Sadunf02G0187200 [Salix dunnii]|uniref:Uncharacterized protein n=1 Tax=Salix dunnii TaxID=1413687 RepID=A0A835N919_9ROSI|nr:hypothetical protein SADUNF_Sadunf02G0187200 [Salix dunnii]